MSGINFATFRYHFSGRFRGQQVHILHAEGENLCGEAQRGMEVQGACVWGVCVVLVKVGREGLFEMRTEGTEIAIIKFSEEHSRQSMVSPCEG